MAKCLRCNEEFQGRIGKIYCTERCRKYAETKRGQVRSAPVRAAKYAAYLAEQRPLWEAARLAKAAARKRVQRTLAEWVDAAVWWPSGCLLWVGPVDRDGYPRIRYGGRLTRVARLICGVEDGRRALHTCDVPACINSDHLYVGTGADNTADMMRRGRNHAVRENGRFARKAAFDVG